MSKLVLVLNTQDNKKVKFEAEQLKKHSVLIGYMLDFKSKEQEKPEMVLPFHNINEATMLLVKKFLDNFSESKPPNRPITTENSEFETVFADDPFRKNFFSELSQEQLVDLVNASNFMDIPHLQESVSCAIAIHLKQASLAYAKDVFNADDDYLAKPLEGVIELDLELQKLYLKPMEKREWEY